jgi:hypothetical protein
MHGERSHQHHGHGGCGCQKERESQGHGGGGHECGCHGGGHGDHFGFRRRFQTNAEKVAGLEAYLADLKAEVQAVEERLAGLRT